MKTVAVIEGWAEGPWHSCLFYDRLTKAGFEISETHKADVIVAHSLGCYLIPAGNKAKLIVLIGLPHWPGRTLAGGVTRKLLAEIKYHRQNQGLGWWFRKTLHNCWYIISKPQDTLYVFTRTKIKNLPTKTKVMLVRPSKDPNLEPTVARKLAKDLGYKFIEVAGTHDDCWSNPTPYIDLLLKEL